MKKKDSVVENGFSLSDAAIAAGVEPTRLKNWLDRSQVRLDGERPEVGKHRRFSFVDVVRIAVVGRLTRFGIKVERADALVARVIDPVKPPPAAKLVRNWKEHDVSLLIAYDPEKDEYFHHPHFRGEEFPTGFDTYLV